MIATDISHYDLALSVFEGSASEEEIDLFGSLVRSESGDFASVSSLIFSNIHRMPARHNMRFWGLLAQFPPSPTEWSAYLDEIELNLASKNPETRRGAALHLQRIAVSSYHSFSLANERLWTIIVRQVTHKDKVLKRSIIENALSLIYRADNFEVLLPDLLVLFDTKFESKLDSILSVAAIAGHDVSAALPHLEHLGRSNHRPTLVHHLQRREINAAIRLFDSSEEYAEAFAGVAGAYIETQYRSNELEPLLRFIRHILNNKDPGVLWAACRASKELAIQCVDISNLLDQLMQLLTNTQRLDWGNVSIHASQALIAALSLEVCSAYLHSSVLTLFGSSGKNKNAAAYILSGHACDKRDVSSLRTLLNANKGAVRCGILDVLPHDSKDVEFLELLYEQLALLRDSALSKAEQKKLLLAENRVLEALCRVSKNGCKLSYARALLSWSEAIKQPLQNERKVLQPIAEFARYAVIADKDFMPAWRLWEIVSILQGSLGVTNSLENWIRLSPQDKHANEILRLMNSSDASLAIIYVYQHCLHLPIYEQDLL